MAGSEVVGIQGKSRDPADEGAADRHRQGAHVLRPGEPAPPCEPGLRRSEIMSLRWFGSDRLGSLSGCDEAAS